MKNSFTAFAAGICLISALHGGTMMKTGTDTDGRSYQYADQDPFQLRIYRLNNGMQVYLSVNRVEPTVNLMTLVKAGSVDEPRNSTGLAHYLEHMLFKGTDRIGALDWPKEKKLLDRLEQLFEERRKTPDPVRKEELYREIDKISSEAAQYASPGEFSKLADSLGAMGLNAATSCNYTFFVVKVPSGELEKFLYLETERFRNPVLRLFHTELETVYEEFNRGQDDDSRRSLNFMLEKLFPGHPVGRSVIGQPEHIKYPSMKDTTAFFRKFYVPSNMAVIMTGDFQHEEVMRMLEKTLGTLPAGPSPVHENCPIGPRERHETVALAGPAPEHFRIGFRLPLTPENRMLSYLLSTLLSDQGYGILDQNLFRAGKIQSVWADSFELQDQIVFLIYGKAMKGQSMEQAVDLVMGELKRVENGDFEKWRIPAIAENIRIWLASLRRKTEGELNDELAAIFRSGLPYSYLLNLPEEAEKTAPEKLAGFVRDHLKNGVTVYKRHGKAENIVKVEKPEITPVQLKSGVNSPFAEDFLKQETVKRRPETLDENQVLSRKALASGRKFVRINRDYGDGLFNARIVSPRGKFHDRRIDLAMGYLNFLGTDRYSAEELRQEFYKIGVKLASSTTAHFSTMEISGPHGKYAQAMELFNHVVRNMKPDEKALRKYKSRVLKTMENAKKNPRENFIQGSFYAWYGPKNPFVNVLSREELEKITAEELVNLIKQIFTEKAAEIHYSGPADMQAASAEAEKFPVIEGEPVPKRPFYPYRKPETPTVWVVDYDKVQLTIALVASGEPFNPDDMAFESLVNEYFFSGLDSVVFQEIREARALAYSASGAYSLQTEKNYDSRTFLMVETQQDKALDAVKTALSLLRDMPFHAAKFQAAKQSVLKKLASERLFSYDVFDFFHFVHLMGISGDWRAGLYEKIERMDESEFRRTAKEKLAGSVYDIVVVGKPDGKLLKELARFGKVEKLTSEQIFGY